MHWSVVAPFIRDSGARWIDDSIEGSAHTFVKVPRVGTEISWHARHHRYSSAGEWRDYMLTALAARRLGTDGVITVFPQLAAMSGALKRVSPKPRHVVAWFFDTELSSARLWFARQTLHDVDRFVVHTNVERELFPRILHLPPDRFRFAHLQYGDVLATDAEEEEHPFVFATGSGFRDYGTFFGAMKLLGYPTKVLAGPRILAGLEVPSNVEILDDIPKRAIHSLVRRARVNAVPLTNEGITAGGVTIVETFRHARPVVISDRAGLSDYIEHDVNSLVVKRHDVKLMAEAIEAMWSDAGLRERLGKGAEAFAELHCTDDAAASVLRSILDEFL